MVDPAMGGKSQLPTDADRAAWFDARAVGVFRRAVDGVIDHEALVASPDRIRLTPTQLQVVCAAYLSSLAEVEEEGQGVELLWALYRQCGLDPSGSVDLDELVAKLAEHYRVYDSRRPAELQRLVHLVAA